MLYLKKLSLADGADIYEMLQEILGNDNGFHNKVYGKTFDEYRAWLAREYAFDNGELEDWMVPQSSYWMYDDGIPVGYGRLRHLLDDNLRKTGGNIGYAIRSSQRGNGYGNRLLALLLEECKAIGIKEVQVAANEDNEPSNKIIRRNGGVLLRNENNKNFYIIRIE